MSIAARMRLFVLSMTVGAALAYVFWGVPLWFCIGWAAGSVYKYADYRVKGGE